MRFHEALAERFGPSRVRSEASLAPLTTFKVGGPAEWLIETTSAANAQASVAATTVPSLSSPPSPAPCLWPGYLSLPECADDRLNPVAPGESRP